MRRRWMAGVVLAVAGSLGLAGCDLGSGPEDGTRLSIFLTDAPGDVESVWIDIDGIVLIGDELGDVEVPDDFLGLIEVTELVGRARELVDDFDVGPDTFRQLRLVLGGAVLLTKDGEVFATEGADLPDDLDVDEDDIGLLQCPSCAQSGIKVKVQGKGGEIDEDDDVALVLDFDVARSFGHRAGKSGRWIMHPVVHATWVESDEPEEVASSIQGTVAIQTNSSGQPAFAVPQCPAGTNRSITDFIPIATAQTLKDSNEDAVVRSGQVQANGTFSIGFVAPDTYTLGFSEVTLGTMKLVWTATVAPAQATITAGTDVTGVAYTLTGASCVANP